MRSTRKRTPRRRSSRRHGGRIVNIIENITFVFLTGQRMTLNSTEDTETVLGLKETVRQMKQLPNEARIRLIVNNFELRDDFRTLRDYQLAERLERPGTLIKVHVSYPR
jgi:beta-lactamase class A